MTRFTLFKTKRKGTFVKGAILTFIALLVMGILLFPVYYAFIVSLKPSGGLATTEIELIPKEVTLRNYKDILFGHYEGNFIASGGAEFSARTASIKFTNATLDYEIKIENVEGNTQRSMSIMAFYITEIKEEENKLTIDAEKIETLGLVQNVSLYGEHVVVKLYRGLLEETPIGTQKLTYIGNNTYEGNEITLFIDQRVRIKLENVHFVGYNPINVNIYKIGGKFPNYMKNSLILAGLNVLFTIIFVVPAAYAFSRVSFAGRGHILYFYLIFTQVGGGLGIAGLVALYGILLKFGLTNNLVALSLVYAAGGVPFNTWLLKTYIDTIPTEFDEAALVDGASYWQVIWKVIFPMALPGIATVAIFAFIGGWTELILANLLITNEGLRPLAVKLYADLAIIRELSWTYFTAEAILFAIPVAVIFFIGQRWMRGGLTLGGLKG